MTTRLIVSIHQPNYLPWLGYFHKIAVSDCFVFLDNAQFTKGGYINRVRVMGAGEPRWLTIPMSVHLGNSINKIFPAVPDWGSRHLDVLHSLYSGAPCFKNVWPRLKEMLLGSGRSDLATINRHLIESLSDELKLSCRFFVASELPVSGLSGDDRLIALVKAVAPSGVYVSGQGGAKYQNPDKFTEAKLGFRFANFHHPEYDQGGGQFVPGLSVIDSLFRIGWAGTADLIAGTAKSL